MTPRLARVSATDRPTAGAPVVAGRADQVGTRNGGPPRGHELHHGPEAVGRVRGGGLRQDGAHRPGAVHSRVQRGNGVDELHPPDLGDT